MEIGVEIADRPKICADLKTDYLVRLAAQRFEHIRARDRDSEDEGLRPSRSDRPQRCARRRPRGDAVVDNNGHAPHCLGTSPRRRSRRR